MDDELIRPREAAKILGSSVQHVRNLIMSGRLPAVNVARDLATRPTWRLRKNIVEEFVMERTFGARRREMLARKEEKNVNKIRIERDNGGSAGPGPQH